MFGMMEFCGVLLAVFLGAVALSAEVKNRTIVPILSRPVGRISFFFAKWIGTVAFLTLFVGVGVVAGSTIAFYWGLRPSPLFAVGGVEILLELAVLSASVWRCRACSIRFCPVTVPSCSSTSTN